MALCVHSNALAFPTILAKNAAPRTVAFVFPFERPCMNALEILWPGSFGVFFCILFPQICLHRGSYLVPRIVAVCPLPRPAGGRCPTSCASVFLHFSYTFALPRRLYALCRGRVRASCASVFLSFSYTFALPRWLHFRSAWLPVLGCLCLGCLYSWLPVLGLPL